MEPVTIDFKGKQLTLDLVAMTYPNGRLAIQAVDASDGIAWGILTVNVPDLTLDENSTAIKDYDENESWASKVLDALIERGDCKRTGTIALPHNTIPVVTWNPWLVVTA